MSFCKQAVLFSLLGLLLQNCYNQREPFHTPEQEPERAARVPGLCSDQLLEEDTPHNTCNLESELASQLSEKVFIAADRHQVKFRYIENRWLANVQLYEIEDKICEVPVYIAAEMELKQLLTLPEDEQRYRIHIIFFQDGPKKRLPACVYVGSMGLKGGGGNSSKCAYPADEAVWDEELRRWVCPGSERHPRSEPPWHRIWRQEEERRREQQRREEERRREEQRRREEERRREEAKKREQERLRRQREMDEHIAKSNAEEEKLLEQIEARHRRLAEQFQKEEADRKEKKRILEEEYEKKLAAEEEERQRRFEEILREVAKQQAEERRQEEERRLHEERQQQEARQRELALQQEMEKKKAAEEEKSDAEKAQEVDRILSEQLQAIKAELAEAQLNLQQEQEQGKDVTALAKQVEEIVTRKELLEEIIAEWSFEGELVEGALGKMEG